MKYINFVQLIGFFGIALNFVIFQQKDRKKMLHVKLYSDITWATHYFLLGAFSGTAVAVLGVFRECVFYNKDKKWANHIIWPILFITVGIFISFLTRKNMFWVFPAIASSLSVICFRQDKTSKSRLYALPISACMFTYSLIFKSYAGVTNEILTVASVIIGYLKNDRSSVM